MGKVSKGNRALIIVCLLSIPFVLVTFRAAGFSPWLVGGTVLFFVIMLLGIWLLQQRLNSIKQLINTNLVECGKQVLHYQKAHIRQEILSAPLLAGWVVWLIMEIRDLGHVNVNAVTYSALRELSLGVAIFC